MNDCFRYDANYIKSLLIDLLISMNDNVVIGSEVMYGIERKIADIVLLKSNRTTAFEIKSKYDSFSKLQSQLAEYCKLFNYVYIIIDESHTDKMHTIDLPQGVGLISITNKGNFEFIKKAKLQKSLVKSELAYTINIEYIKRHYPNLNGDSDTIRQFLCKRSIKTIETLFYSFLMNKINPRFKLFLDQRGSYTHTDDLFLLSFPNSVIL